jgi:Beta protein
MEVIMYFPLLKNANNEMKALRELKESSRDKLIPIIESKRVKKENIDNWESQFNTLGNYLKERVKEIKFIYDFNCAFEEIGDEKKLTTELDVNIVDHCLKKMEDASLNVIPCFHHDSPDWMVTSVLNSGYKDVAIRIRCNNFQESFDRFVFDKVKSDLALADPTLNVFIILDFFSKETSEDRIKNLIEFYSKLSNSKIVYLATSCPDNANEATVNSVSLIGPRKELNIFRTLKKQYESLCFGDYTTRLKGEILSGFNMNNSYLKIFYTTETDYWIAKSKIIRDGGEETFYSVCKDLTEYDFYPGPDFSFGDKEILKCANKEITIAEHQAPIAIAVNHHIETTISQLLELPHSPVSTSF